jgi:hypothetical protein
VTAYVVPNDSLLADGKTGMTQWWFQAFNPETGQPYLGKDGLLLTVPASASALVWPDDF